MLPRMTSGQGTIAVPPEELYALARGLHAHADAAHEAVRHLAGLPEVGGPLTAAVAGFLDSHRTAAAALAAQLAWLGGTVAAVADSWLGLDRGLLAPRGQAAAR